VTRLHSKHQVTHAAVPDLTALVLAPSVLAANGGKLPTAERNPSTTRFPHRWHIKPTAEAMELLPAAGVVDQEASPAVRVAVSPVLLDVHLRSPALNGPEVGTRRLPLR